MTKKTPYATDLAPRDISALEVKKAVEAIAIRPQAGKITLLMRKAFNVLLYYAQEQGHDQKVYRVRLAELVHNASYESNDYEAFKEYLRRMVSTNVEWNSTNEDGERRWGISNMLAEAEIIKKPGGIVVEYSFAPKIKERLLDPVVYTRLSLRFQSSLRSNAAVALYEMCSRYATSPRGLTLRAAWVWWRPVLTGSPDIDGEREFAEYKYFKRDVLKPAVAEVNKLTDVEVELIEHKEGRRVSEIQFRVARKAQSALELGDAPVIDSSVIQRIMAFGIGQSEANTIYADNDEGYLRATIELVEERIKKEGAARVMAPAAYFKDALRKSYAAGRVTKLPKTVKLTAVDTRKKILEQFIQHQRNQARQVFGEYSKDQQLEAQTRFEADRVESDPVLSKQYKKKGLASKMVEAAFVVWLSQFIWGEEPTETDLMNFAIESGIVKV